MERKLKEIRFRNMKVVDVGLIVLCIFKGEEGSN